MPDLLVVEPEGIPLAERLVWATSWAERRRGLRGRSPLVGGEALVLCGSPQVHSFGMHYPIDIVFCDRLWRVRHVQRSLVPSRLSRFVWRAWYAVELRAGSVPAALVAGDHISVRRR